jgi:glycosyltransferase involved in cell wall biosynthesis
MRFLIISQYFEPEIGAAQVRLGAFARGLVKEGHEVEVVTGMPNHPNGRIAAGYRKKLTCFEEIDGIRIRRVWLYASTGSGLRRIFNYLSFMFASPFGLARSKRPDFIFVESPPLSVMVPARLFAFMWRRPIIMNVADLWPDAAENLGLIREGKALRALQRLESKCYRSSKFICSATDGIREILETKKGVPPGKILDLPNGADIRLFRPRETDRSILIRYDLEENDIFLYAGTVGFAHRLETAVDAMVRIQDQFPKAHLLVVGGGSEWENVSAYARKINASNVTFAGPVTLEEVSELLNVALATVSTIRDSEVMKGVRPSKIFPSMASGVPVLYSGAGEGAEIISASGAGLVSPPEEPKALAENMKALLLNANKVEQMGSAGRRLMEERFSWPSIVNGWLSQLNDFPCK